MTEKAEYIVRQAKREDMVKVLKIGQDSGWNKLLEQLYFIFDLFTEGVFVAESREGEIISHCASFHLDEDNGFMSKYITKENWRRKGIGREVFDMSFKALGKKNVGLTAVEDFQAMYASLGFKISTAWFKTYQCPSKYLKININNAIAQSEGKLDLIQIKNISMDRILAYDNKIHSIKRKDVLYRYLEAAHMGFAAMDSDGKLAGWGLLYRGFTAYCVMPLYADTHHIARILLHTLLAKVTGEKDAIIEVIFPVENTDAGAMFEEFGFSACGNRLRRRMFTQCDIPFEANFVFSVLNLDTGIV